MQLSREEMAEFIDHLNERNMEDTRRDLLYFVEQKEMLAELLEFFRRRDPDYLGNGRRLDRGWNKENPE